MSSLLRSCFRRLLMAVTRVEGTLQAKGPSLEAGRSLLRSATCRPQRRGRPRMRRGCSLLHGLGIRPIQSPPDAAGTLVASSSARRSPPRPLTGHEGVPVKLPSLPLSRSPLPKIKALPFTTEAPSSSMNEDGARGGAPCWPLGVRANDESCTAPEERRAGQSMQDTQP